MRAIVAKQAASVLTRKAIDKLTEAARGIGAKGLAFIRWVEENYPDVDWMTDIQTRYDLYNDYFYRSMSNK